MRRLPLLSASLRRLAFAVLLSALLGCAIDPVRHVSVTVRTVPPVGPMTAAPRLPNAGIQYTCPNGRGGFALGPTDARGELEWQALGTHDPRCAITARASGHQDQTVRIADAQGGRPGRHFLAVQFDLVRDLSTQAPPAVQPAIPTAPVKFTSSLDGVEIRYRDRERTGPGLTAEPRLCITPCSTLDVPLGKPIVLARGHAPATMSAPVQIEGPSVVDIRYVDRSTARGVGTALAAVALAGLGALLVGTAAERSDVALVGGGLFAVSLAAGLFVPQRDAARVEVRRD